MTEIVCPLCMNKHTTGTLCKKCLTNKRIHGYLWNEYNPFNQEITAKPYNWKTRS